MTPNTEKMPEGRRYRGASNEQRRSERRAKLISAGVRLFGTAGFHATTVRNICGEAQLTERYFYESFSNTEALFEACYLHIIDEVRRRVFKALEEVGGDDLMRGARAGLRELFALVKENPPAARILLLEVLTVSRAMEALSMKTLNQFVELFMALADPLLGQKKDGAAPFDPLLISAGLVGGTLHIAGKWAMDGYKQPLDTVVDSCMRIFEAMRSGM